MRQKPCWVSVLSRYLYLRSQVTFSKKVNSWAPGTSFLWSSWKCFYSELLKGKWCLLPEALNVVFMFTTQLWEWGRQEKCLPQPEILTTINQEWAQPPEGWGTGQRPNASPSHVHSFLRSSEIVLVSKIILVSSMPLMLAFFGLY